MSNNSLLTLSRMSALCGGLYVREAFREGREKRFKRDVYGERKGLILLQNSFLKCPG